MSEAHFYKLDGMLVPAEEECKALLDKIPKGEAVKVKFTRPRNYQFHKKYFSMLDYAFDVWDPEDVEVPAFVTAHGLIPEKNKDRFRSDIIIAAGYYKPPSINLNGDVRLEAKSIAFGNMEEDDFALLYNATIDAVLKHVLKNYTRDDLDVVLEGLMQYA